MADLLLVSIRSDNGCSVVIHLDLTVFCRHGRHLVMLLNVITLVPVGRLLGPDILEQAGG